MTDRKLALMAPERLPKPPSHLRAAGKKLWKDVVTGFELGDHDLHVLAAACEAADRVADAREVIDTNGGIVAANRLALATERDSRTAMLRALRELGLNLETTAAPKPPTRWRGR
jgi:phage terminase small subunit